MSQIGHLFVVSAGKTQFLLRQKKNKKTPIMTDPTLSIVYTVRKCLVDFAGYVTDDAIAKLYSM